MEAKELGASRSELPRMRERWCARKFVGSSPAYKSAGQMCLRLYRKQPAVKSSFPSLLIHVNFFRSYYNSAQVRFFFFGTVPLRRNVGQIKSDGRCASYSIEWQHFLIPITDGVYC